MQKMHIRIILAFILLFILGYSPSGAALDPSSAQSLNAKVRSLVSQAKLGKSSVAVSVRNCSNNQELVGINAGQAMIPASNMKIFSKKEIVCSLDKQMAVIFFCNGYNFLKHATPVHG